MWPMLSIHVSSVCQSGTMGHDAPCASSCIGQFRALNDLLCSTFIDETFDVIMIHVFDIEDVDHLLTSAR